MKSYFILFLFSPLAFAAQNCSTTALTVLDQTVKETSGLIFFDGKLVTHNDSGDSPNLYEIDTINGSVIRTVTVSNATNIDWEDIAQDDNFIYIGDFGNNNGNRTNLAIYIIDKVEFNSQTTVTADTILIQYADQTNFSSQPNNNNYDCEAMITFQDSLMLFSKNWENEKTYLYTLPKTAGTYNLVKRDSFDTQGTITGATYNSFSNEILLIGYRSSNFSKYLWKLAQFQGYKVLSGANTKCNLNITGSIQVEAIASKSNIGYFISSEEVTQFGITFDTYLSSYETSVNTSIGDKKKFRFELFPNPVDNYLNYIIRNITQAIHHRVKITNTVGEVLYERENVLETQNKIDTSSFPSGIYYVSIISDDVIQTQPFIKK
jgi:hypothetical protein